MRFLLFVKEDRRSMFIWAKGCLERHTCFEIEAFAIALHESRRCCRIDVLATRKARYQGFSKRIISSRCDYKLII